MSIPNLPVDFKDDILNTGVNQKRKYQQTYNSDGSVSFEDVTAYQQKGSDFGAQQVNETNGAVNNIYAERIVDLDELELVTEPGFFVDALAVKELNSKLVSVPITLIPESSNLPSGVSYRCWSYPALGLAFLRIYLPSRASKVYEQGEEYTLYTIPSGDGYPAFSSALYVHGGVNNRIDARVNNGAITITPRLQDVATNNIITVGGFWFTGQ